MAIKLVANYAKKAGLPGYSSHQFAVSVETEIVDLARAEEETSRLYALLQRAVDRELENPGFVPEPGYGMGSGERPDNDNPDGARGAANGEGHRPAATRAPRRPPETCEAWNCSDRQRELILRLTVERELDKNAVEDLAVRMFGVGVRRLNRLQASNLIDELLRQATEDADGGSRDPRPRNGSRRAPARREAR